MEDKRSIVKIATKSTIKTRNVLGKSPKVTLKDAYKNNVLLSNTHAHVSLNKCGEHVLETQGGHVLERLKMYSCTYCCYQSESKIFYVKHLFQAHNSATNFRYECGISSCSRVFVAGDSFDAFRSHCTRYHHNWKEHLVIHDEEDAFSDMDTHEVNMDLTSSQTVSAATPYHTATELSLTYGERSEYCYGNEYVGEITRDAHYPRHEDIVVNAAHFILNLKEKFKLSQVSLDFVIQSVEELLRVSADNIKQSILTTLHQEGIEIAPSLSDKCVLLPNPFLYLKTEYQQAKFFKENFNLIVRFILAVYNGFM